MELAEIGDIQDRETGNQIGRCTGNPGTSMIELGDRERWDEPAHCRGTIGDSLILEGFVGAVYNGGHAEARAMHHPWGGLPRYPARSGSVHDLLGR